MGLQATNKVCDVALLWALLSKGRTAEGNDTVLGFCSVAKRCSLNFCSDYFQAFNQCFGVGRGLHVVPYCLSIIVHAAV